MPALVSLPIDPAETALRTACCFLHISCYTGGRLNCNAANTWCCYHARDSFGLTFPDAVSALTDVSP